MTHGMQIPAAAQAARAPAPVVTGILMTTQIARVIEAAAAATKQAVLAGVAGTSLPPASKPCARCTPIGGSKVQTYHCAMLGCPRASGEGRVCKQSVKCALFQFVGSSQDMNGSYQKSLSHCGYCLLSTVFRALEAVDRYKEEEIHRTRES